mgnify:CR=1 FL=1
MIEKLKIREIYNDFTYKFMLNDDEKNVLDLLLKRKKIVAISLELGMSEPNVSIIIKKLKNYYQKYEELERLKIKIFNL